ncbi:hypothetical protein [Tumebacillus lipolyticus]|uniref:Uncharacterized protein n=1 Tax=Tumebacillus lipolyticus TaxID=1280370 RepID=A0ABW4ZUM8_9BACL
MENILLFVIGAVGIIFTFYGLWKRKYGKSDAIMMLVQIVFLLIAYLYRGEIVGKVAISIVVLAMLVELIIMLRRRKEQKG